MIRLAQNQFHQALSLLDLSQDNIQVLSIIEGRSKGEVFLSSKENPVFGAIYSYGMFGFYLLSTKCPDGGVGIMKKEFKKTILPFLKSINGSCFEASSDRNEIIPVLVDSFRQYSPTSSIQLVRKRKSLNPIPPGKYPCKIMPISREVLNSSITNIKRLNKLILETWISLESFFSHGFGFCAFKGDKLVGMCLTGFTSSPFVEFSIETMEDSRQKGIGYATGTLCVNEAIKRNLIPYWECYDTNMASIAVATKLGFTLESDYSMIQIAT